ncbi:MAG: hypothetical protein LBG80_12855 [Bacteroidales bacterium]|jgi:hypothetical protein|nr:hypothetical protein [Bacteroidales bacterium]
MKILIIENQWIEFAQICEKLCSNGYDILLDITDNTDNTEEIRCVCWGTDDNEQKFISLATKIRIWVDEDNGYTQEYRNKAFALISELAKRADIIIIDHILGGSYSCLTGIDLAEKLVEDIGIEKMPPVLFLSKTESNEKNLKDRYENTYIREGKEKSGYKKFIMGKYQKQNSSLKDDELRNKVNAHTKWVHKGYFGDEILQPEYIEKYVIEEGIEELLPKNIRQKLIEKLTEWKNSEVPNCSDIRTKINNLLSILNAETDIKSEIKQYILETNLSDNNIAGLDVNKLK